MLLRRSCHFLVSRLQGLLGRTANLGARPGKFDVPSHPPADASDTAYSLLYGMRVAICIMPKW